MENQAIFQFETPAGTFFADPIEVIRKLRVATHNRIDELIDKADYFAAIDAPVFIEDENGNKVVNPNKREFDPESEDSRRLLHEANLATEQVYDAFRYAFKLSRFDSKTGNGVTEGFLIDLIRSFLDFVKRVKKNTPQ